MRSIEVGWRIPEFPIKGRGGPEFVEQILRSLERVEHDFDSAWLSDHMIPWANWQDPATDNLEAWTTVSHLMGVFRRLSFGHIVLCNSYRNPAFLAKMAATLCYLAPGRFILGIGAGWKQDEYTAYGYDFPSASARVGALGEGVQIIRKMWTEESVNFEGKYYKIKDAYCNPKPKPIPPIMIGGSGEKLLLKLVASQADWWNMLGQVDEYQRKSSILRTHCEKVGRDYNSLRKTWLGCVSVAEDQQEAERIARNSPFTASEVTVMGNVEQVTRKLKEYVNVGVTYFILRFLDFPSLTGATLFAEKVLPQLK